MPADRLESDDITKARKSEPAVSWWRWILAVLVGLIVWSMAPQWLPTGYSIVGNLIGGVLGIVVAGLIVGARSVRRWLVLVLVIAALAIGIAVAAFFLLALSGI